MSVHRRKKKRACRACQGRAREPARAEAPRTSAPRSGKGRQTKAAAALGATSPCACAAHLMRVSSNLRGTRGSAVDDRRRRGGEGHNQNFLARPRHGHGSPLLARPPSELQRTAHRCRACAHSLPWPASGGEGAAVRSRCCAATARRLWCRWAALSGRGASGGHDRALHSALMSKVSRRPPLAPVACSRQDVHEMPASSHTDRLGMTTCQSWLVRQRKKAGRVWKSVGS